MRRTRKTATVRPAMTAATVPTRSPTAAWPTASAPCRAAPVFDDAHLAHVAARLLQHGARVELIDLLGSAGAVLQLLGRIALEDKEAARLQRAAHAGPLPCALGGRRELREYFNDDIESGL